MELYVSHFVVFMLLFVRITSLVVTAPVLGYTAVPVQVKVALSLFLALVFFPVGMAQAPPLDTRLLPLVIVVLKEVAVGVLLGFVLQLIFAGVRFAGDLIGFGMGFSLASVFDPESVQNVSVLGQVLYVASLLLFLLLNGHHFVIEALHLSYRAVPIGGFELTAFLGRDVVRLTGFIFVIAVKLAAPVMVALFLVDVGLAVLARVVPQMNIFVLGFSVKVGVGIAMVLTTAPMMVYVFKKLLMTFERDVLELVKAL
jgi:flagellar biosynthetic protein FliR